MRDKLDFAFWALFSNFNNKVQSSKTLASSPAIPTTACTLYKVPGIWHVAHLRNKAPAAFDETPSINLAVRLRIHQSNHDVFGGPTCSGRDLGTMHNFGCGGLGTCHRADGNIIGILLV